MSPNNKSYKEYGFDSHLTKKALVKKNDNDYSVHGKKIEQRTLPIILPIKTTIQRDGIKAIKGQMIYNTDTEEVDIWDGVQWISCQVTSTSTSSVSTSSSSITTTTL